MKVLYWFYMQKPIPCFPDFPPDSILCFHRATYQERNQHGPSMIADFPSRRLLYRLVQVIEPASRYLTMNVHWAYLNIEVHISMPPNLQMNCTREFHR